jgi:hypothetical protein
MPSHASAEELTPESSMRGLQTLAACMLGRYERAAEGAPPETTLVFVLGAEASRASCLQDWKSFGESLVDDLSGRYLHGADDAFLDDALTRLQPLIGPAPTEAPRKKAFLQKKATPEQILEVACRNTIFEKQVRAKLADAYGPERAPQLGYELIAHFLRHRFIDHVINFNWDEILDRAIDSELGSAGYERILPAGPPNSTRMRGLPRLFKLHGTASSPGSLRFTTAETGLLSLGMLELLDDSLFGIQPTDQDAVAPRKCHLVSFGYRWADADFVNYVVAHWERIERITVVRGSPRFPEEVKRLFCLAYRDSAWESSTGKGKISVVSADQLATMPGNSAGKALVDHLLWGLWELIRREMEDRPQPERLRLTPVARHILLGLYFAPQRDGVVLPLERDRDHYRSEAGPLFRYSEDRRLRIEFFLHVMKCTGMINLSPMGQDPRVVGALDPKRGAGTLSSLLDETGAFLPSRASSMRETYFLTPGQVGEGNSLLKSPGIVEVAATTVATVLGIDRVASNRTPKPVWVGSNLTFQNVEMGELFRDCAREIFDADDVEVLAADDSRNRVLFVNPQPLTSFARLSKESSTLLAEPWDVLLVIAESGRWIFKALADSATAPTRRQVFLIRTSGRDLDDWKIGEAYDDDIETRIEELGRRGIETCSLAMPWWRHNRHMTLALRRDGEAYQLGRGIYFRRRLKSHRIAPVLVEKAGDCFDLLLLFLSYTVRAADGSRDGAAVTGGAIGSTGLADLRTFAHALKGVVGQVKHPAGRASSARARLFDEIDQILGLLEARLA